MCGHSETPITSAVAVRPPKLLIRHNDPSGSGKSLASIVNPLMD